MKMPTDYWNDDTVVQNIRPICEEIGHFPTDTELRAMNRGDLAYGIWENGGYIKFRTLLGYDLKHKRDGYWNDETIIQELKPILDKIGRFPTHDQLQSMARCDLGVAIERNGGYIKFQELCGYPVSLHEKYISSLMSYVGNRGKNSERIVKKIIREYCAKHHIAEPLLNVKLSKSNVIEFVCDTGKTIGIDVTNTDSKGAVSKKWKHKEYSEQLDELWIIVFGVFTDKDYRRWNDKSPDNVRIFSIDGFLKELDYSLDEHTRNKIDKYCKCTFHNKDDLKTPVKMSPITNTVLL